MPRKPVDWARVRPILFRILMLASALWLVASYGSSAVWVLVVVVLLIGLEGMVRLGKWGSTIPSERYREVGRYRVVLQVPGPKVIQVIKALREIRDLSLLEAKEMVDSPPVVVAEGLSEQSAELVADRLRAAGARALAAPIGEM
jgi:ribosomal protein L7/L12